MYLSLSLRAEDCVASARRGLPWALGRGGGKFTHSSLVIKLVISLQCLVISHSAECAVHSAERLACRGGPTHAARKDRTPKTASEATINPGPYAVKRSASSAAQSAPHGTAAATARLDCHASSILRCVTRRGVWSMIGPLSQSIRIVGASWELQRLPSHSSVVG